ncbi:MAG: hypothetical protein IJS45_11475 [Clostridia bacterium]|nr:hypothetical protein [Clostridia bacterium]
MITVTRIVLIVICALFSLGCLGANQERRGYLDLIGAITTAILLLLSFRII